MVLLPVVPMTASVPERAAHLLTFVSELYTKNVLDSEQKLNLICHRLFCSTSHFQPSMCMNRSVVVVWEGLTPAI
jgi:acetate kinase